MIIRYLPNALSDLEEALSSIQSNADAAQRFADTIRAREQAILDFPEKAYSPGGTLRVHWVTRFPYSLAYLPLEGDILIIAVARHKRRPANWTSRLHNVDWHA
jgi:plasmid stabilization system protein ParE